MNVSKVDLLAALRALAPAVPKKTALPLLQGVRLTFDGSTLRMHATDLTFGVERTIMGDGDPFDTVFPFKLFSEIVKSSGDVVSLDASSVDGTKIAALDPDDFPNLFGWQGVDGVVTPLVFTHLATLDGASFSSLLSRVAYAASKDTTRPVLTGVHLEGKRGVLTAVCADGFRLALASMAYEGVDFKLLPPVALEAVLKAQGAGALTLSEREGQICLSFQGGRIVSRLLDGTFPDFRQIIPKEAKGEFTVAANALGAAMKALRPFTKTNLDVARFHLGEMNETLTVSGKHSEGQEMRKALTVEHAGEFSETAGDAPSHRNNWKEQEPTRNLALNEGYVSDLASAYKGKRLTFGVNSPNFAVKVTVDGEAIGVIMPLVIGRS